MELHLFEKLDVSHYQLKFLRTNYHLRALVEKLQQKGNHYNFWCLKKLYLYILDEAHYHHLFLRFRVKKELVDIFLIHQNFWDIIFDNLTPQFQQWIFHILESLFGRNSGVTMKLFFPTSQMCLIITFCRRAVKNWQNFLIHATKHACDFFLILE